MHFLPARYMRSQSPRPFGCGSAVFQRSFKLATGRDFPAWTMSNSHKEQHMSRAIIAPALPNDLSSRDLPVLSDSPAFSMNVRQTSHKTHQLLISTSC
jgi:hypothetical protein